MPGSLFNFSKYFKNKDKKKEEDKSSQQGEAASSEMQQTETTTTSKTTVSSQGARPYSGIGKPSSGAAYSGIGRPPQVQTDQAADQAGSSPGTQKPSRKITSQPQSVSQKAADKTKDGEGQEQKDAQSQITDEVKTPSQMPPSSQASIDMKKRVGMDVLSRLTQRASTALMKSVEKGKELNVKLIDTEHVLWGLLTDRSVYQLISECKVVPSELQGELDKRFKRGKFSGQPQFSPRVKRVLELSLSAARSLGYEFISPEHIFLALSHEGEGVAAQVLNKFGLKTEVLNQKITGKKELKKDKKEEEKGASTLERFTEDLTVKAQKGELDPVVRRSKEIERVIHILSRRTKNNPVLIGDAGVGKTAIVEGLALRIAQGDVPETLLHKRILSLDLMSLIAGARHRGEFEERLKNLIKEVKASSGAIILFIDELHNMVGAGSGSEGTMDASNILKPSLARGELQAIGTTTIAEFRKHIEKDPALERRFQPVLIPEPSVEDAIDMLKALRDKYEAFHRVKISDEAIEAAVRLSYRYIGDRYLPDKAVDLIDEAAAAVRLPAISLPEEIKKSQDKAKRLEEEIKEAEKIGDEAQIESLKKETQELEAEISELTQKYKEKKSTTTNSVAPEIIADIVSRWTNIPVSRLTESESSKLLGLEDIIHKRLIDQERAVEAVSEAVRRGRAGLKSTKRPIGSFVFLGPTGVGKTELAKTLAETLFGSEEMMVRLDMTEYMEKHEVAKLIGAPPGYVGYEEGGQLTEAVRRRPYSVVLLDEIEKAHPDVFNILIQLLDDGRLTDNKGHTISFKNTIVICTSNIGTGLIQRWMLEGKSENEEKRTEGSKQDVFKTYIVSPTGREIITLKDKMWEKAPGDAEWIEKSLADYFAGSQIISEDDKQIKKSSFQNASFPQELDTHLIAPDGSETITTKDDVWFRTSTTSKEWIAKKIVSFVKGHIVINAMPDKPEQQLPTAKIDTHAISPSNTEIITLNDRFWKRDNLQTKDWVTGTLEDYFKDCVVLTPDAFFRILKKEQELQGEVSDKEEKQTRSSDKLQPVKTQDVAKAQNKNDADYHKKDLQKEKIDKDAIKGEQTEEKTYETQADDQESKKAQKQEDKPEITEEDISANPSHRLPADSWDMHLFKPTGEEIIIAGARFWLRKDGNDKYFVTGEVKDLFDVFEIKDKDYLLPVGQEADKTDKESQEEKEEFAELTDKLMEELRKFFRPELLNRFDEVVVFRPLSRKHMLKIVDLQLDILAGLLKEQGLSFEVTDRAKVFLAEVGYDPIYGARPLRRTVQRFLENPISSMIIKREVSPTDTVVVDLDGDELIFSVRKRVVKQQDQAQQQPLSSKIGAEDKEAEKDKISSDSPSQDKVDAEKPPVSSVSSVKSQAPQQALNQYFTQDEDVAESQEGKGQEAQENQEASPAVKESYSPSQTPQVEKLPNVSQASQAPQQLQPQNPQTPQSPQIRQDPEVSQPKFPSQAPPSPQESQEQTKQQKATG